MNGPSLIGTLGAALLLTACTGSDGGHRPPSGVSGCNHMFSVGDAGTGTGLDWDTGSHRYQDVVALYVCEAVARGGIVVVDAPSGVIVSPARVEVDAPSLVRLTVRVERGGHGRLHVAFLHPGGGRYGEVELPEIVAGTSGWRFADD